MSTPHPLDSARNRPPNIVVILADDMGYADIPQTGADTGIPMPALDRLTAEGTLCTNAYVSAPICTPSRMGILSGRHQSRWGSFSNAWPGAPELPRFHREETLMPEMLKQQGYRTALIGKWHLSGNQATMGEPPPDARGFDEVTCIPGGMASYFDGVLYRDDGSHRPTDQYLTDKFGDLSVDFIRRHRDEPFFLFLAFNAPHAPLEAKEKDMAEFQDEVLDMDRRTYSGMMRALDRNIGQVLDALDEEGLDEHTLVICTNDNGGPGTDKWAPSDNASLNTPLRGYKYDLFEGGIRVPFIARWPGRIPAGATYEGLVSALDILPTGLAAAGVKSPPDNLDGIDLVPLLNGNPPFRDHLCWEMIASIDWQLETYTGDRTKIPWGELDRDRRDFRQLAIRSGPWKLIQYLAPVNEPVNPDLWELYHLDTDIGETRDVSADHPDVIERLSTRFLDWRADTTAAGMD